MTTSVLEDWRTLWAIAAVSFLLFLIGNLPWQLDDYDQAKQAFTSFEVIKEGHWLYQRTPHEGVATKPPLMAWVSAGLFAITRWWELAWRLPSLAAAIALAIMLFRAASATYGSAAGLVALGAFGLNLLTPRLATLVRTDMPLAFVIFLIGLLIWQKIQRQEEWKSRDRAYLFVLLTISMLIKGPIVYAFLLPGIGVFEWWRRRFVSRPAIAGVSGTAHPVLQGTVAAWAGWWPWISSLVVFLFWVAGGVLFQPGFFNAVVMREFLGRFGETIHRPQPFYFYAPHLLHKFAPWSILLIALGVLAVMARRWKIRDAFRDMSPATFWLVCWSLGGLLVMSVIPSKRVDRIFPVIPPLCLLLASQIGSRKPCSHASVSRISTTIDSDLTDHRSAHRTDSSCGEPVATEKAVTHTYRWTAAALLFAIFFSGGYATWKMITRYRDRRDALAVFGRDIRREAEAHHWRYEVVSAKDEGLLLYLRKTHYVEADRAVAEWNAGNLDALVVSAAKAPSIAPQLRGAIPSQLKSRDANKEQGIGYALITR